ncbi:DUF2332 domain-containing protein [Streptomyces sp. NPDC029554]|uniref:DUF2332 domain-containing protein n=1 Tax=Streptomyces sp. NPDC029554 TaxID=3155126 RepID=UPI0033EB8945
MISPDGIGKLRSMAAAMEPDLPASASVLKKLIEDFEGNGPVSRLIGEHPDSSHHFFGLRALAGVRLLVLRGRAPELAAHLNKLTSNHGNDSYNEVTWELSRRSILDNPAEMIEAMSRPIQQHQPGRAALLLRGLGMLKAPRIRILELGACAGLNLLLDKYRWFGGSWEWGDPDSPVRLSAAGPAPGDFTIVDRAGCDLAPLDPADPDDVMILRSFIPPEREIDQMEQDDAIALASRTGLVIDKAHAIPWLTEKLAREDDHEDTLTVVWHSLFTQYLTVQEKSVIEEILTEASYRMPLARVAAEPSDTFPGPPLLQVHVYA